MPHENAHKIAWLNLKHMVYQTFIELEKARTINDVNVPNISTQLAMMNKIWDTMMSYENQLGIQDEAPDRLIS